MATAGPALDRRVQSDDPSPEPIERPQDEGVGWRLILSGPIVAVFTLVVGLIAAAEAGFTFRDPDNVAALYVLEVWAGVALLVCLDIYLRARRRTGMRRPPRAAWAEVRRERWTGRRILIVAAAIVSFYVAYLAYRNLKASIPLLRPGDLFDEQLADLERTLFFGTDPAALLHDLFGTGIAAEILAVFYVAFIVFLPLSLGLVLVFAERLQVGLFFATALSINWILGIATYFILPALGPIYYDPGLFADLPYTEVTRLQDLLMEDRVGFLADPNEGTPQAIAAFASLHVAMSFTALIAVYLLRLGRRWKQFLWAWVILTFVATVYLGWHYVVDDVAGVLMAFVAVGLAWLITGFDPRPRKEPEPSG
jgi:membrane-associated phospholipid phosphatase